MRRIYNLPEDVRNKIAAGEVIERPASVVKELIENSLDASSRHIEIEVVRAGKRLIRVFDDGTGMDREDVMRALDRYATSKLRSFDDLRSLSSYGFRGEALSSIASVSRVRLVSSERRISDAQLSKDPFEGQREPGTCLEVTGGEVTDVRDCPSLGTTIEVRDIFFNTPARLKFLRTEQTENYHVVDVVTRQALSNHSVSFSLVMDSREILSLPSAGSCRERLAQIYGYEFAAELIEIRDDARDISATMLLGRASLARSSRNHQYIFVNKRPVKDLPISHAIYRAYEGFVPKEKHPVFFIYLDIDPGKVDVNVHPTKREVRFSDGRAVKDFVFRSAHAGLKTVLTSANLTSYAQLPSAVSLEKGGSSLNGYTEIAATLPVDRVSDGARPPYNEYMPSLYIGDTFVAVAAPGGIEIVDYHAAHERVNYERFLKRGRENVHRLLFPQQVRLDSGAYGIVVRHRSLLASVGVEIDDFGHNCVIVRGLPALLMDSDAAVLMSDIAASLSEIGAEGNMDDSAHQDVDIAPLDAHRKALAARLACHSSVRGSEVPRGPRLNALLRDLEASDNPAQCPHGRPTRVVFSLHQLRKMFRKS